MVRDFIPDKGDICWATLDLAKGHEQKGRRPVLVLTSKEYNKLSGLCLACPLTSKVKPYPFVILFGDRGAVIVDQIKSLSWEKRKFDYIMKVQNEIMISVLQKLKTLLNI